MSTTPFNASRTVLEVDLAIADEFMKYLLDICRNLTGSYYTLDVPNTSNGRERFHVVNTNAEIQLKFTGFPRICVEDDEVVYRKRA